MSDHTPMPDDSLLARYAARNDALRARIQALPAPGRELAQKYMRVVAQVGRHHEYGALPWLEEWADDVLALCDRMRHEAALEFGRACDNTSHGPGH